MRLNRASPMPLCRVPLLSGAAGLVLLGQAAALLQHGLGEDAVAHGGVVGEHMGHGPRQPAVLENGCAAQECVKLGTTFLWNI